MATVLESPYWQGWAAPSWGVSWGYDGGGTPIPVDEGKLEPAGHWKHLFRQAYGVTTPEVKAVATARARVEQPTPSRTVRIPADTPFITAICRTSGSVSAPFVGVSTTPVVIKTTTKVRVKAPMCGATAGFLRGYGWAVSGRVVSPSCGCGTPSPIAEIYGTGYTVKPHTIRNPTMEEIVMMF
jgi:hypothetical protein